MPKALRCVRPAEGRGQGLGRLKKRRPCWFRFGDFPTGGRARQDTPPAAMGLYMCFQAHLEYGC